MPDLPLPDRFVGGELIGRGPGTEVYRAHDKVLDRSVAVKLFAPDGDALARERMDREGRALARLDHPGLVAVYDSGTYEFRPYLVMQLIVGPTLQARLLEGPLPVPAVLELAARLADALGHVHGRGVVHRDLKPANIFLDPNGRPVLGDFGIALLAGQSRLTSYQEIVGTPAYLAPEQVRGVVVGPAADIYALALVLIECLTGEVEYAGGTKVEAALARLSRAPRIPAGIPNRFADLLRAMTHDQPARRPDARQCAEELSSLVAGDTEPLAAPRNAHRGGLLVAAGACVAIAGVTGILAMTSPTAPAQPVGATSPTSVAPTVPATTGGPVGQAPAEHPVADTTRITHAGSKPTTSTPGQSSVQSSSQGNGPGTGPGTGQGAGAGNTSSTSASAQPTTTQDSQHGKKPGSGDNRHGGG
jgi:serine/threonine protein kinase